MPGLIRSPCQAKRPNFKIPKIGIERSKTVAAAPKIHTGNLQI